MVADRIAACVQEGAEDPETACIQRRLGHARQTGSIARRAARAHGDRLDLVVQRMSGDDRIGPKGGRRVREQSVACEAGCGRQAGCGLVAGPLQDAMRNAETFAEFGNLPGLSGRGGPQTMIDGGGGQRMAVCKAVLGKGPGQCDEQSRRITAAGNGDQETCRAAEGVEKMVDRRFGRKFGQGVARRERSGHQQLRRFCSLATLETTAREALG